MSYEEEGKVLMEEAARRQEIIFEKYKNNPEPFPRLDGEQSYELGEVSRWFAKELKKLKTKYGAEQIGKRENI